MASTSAICNSFKEEMPVAEHNLTTGQHSCKTALYTSSATHSKATTAYSTTQEITGTGYTAGGVVCANVTPALSTDTVVFDWADAQWTTATFTAASLLHYNDTHAGNASIFVIDFGGDQSVSAGNFTVIWPTADASSAIMRLT